MSRYISGFSDLIVQYADYQKASGGWGTERTGRRLNIEYFDRYCSENYPGQPLSQEMVDSWCRKRETETNTSCNTRTGGIRSFIRYLRERGLTEVEPPPSLKNCGNTYIPHAFNKDELARFFIECDAVVSRRPEAKYRMKELVCPVFFRLLYSSGIRTTEARYLKREDADLVHGVLNIRKSKGNSQHYVALHESMAQLLIKYDRAAEKLRPGREYFFEPANGLQGCSSHCGRKQTARAAMRLPMPSAIIMQSRTSTAGRRNPLDLMQNSSIFQNPWGTAVLSLRCIIIPWSHGWRTYCVRKQKKG